MTPIHDAHGHATRDEIRDWVANQIDAVGAIAQLPTWAMLVNSEQRWPIAQQQIFDTSFLPHCSDEADGEHAVSVKVELLSDPLEIDTRAAATLISENWASQGWETTQIAPGYFRADRADGALMIIEGSDRPTGKRLSLKVQSACSADQSLAG